MIFLELDKGYSCQEDMEFAGNRAVKSHVMFNQRRVAECFN